MKTLTNSVHGALNRCREGLKGLTDAEYAIVEKQHAIQEKRKALNKEMRQLRTHRQLVGASYELLDQIRVVLADAVVRADKEAKEN